MSDSRVPSAPSSPQSGEILQYGGQAVIEGVMMRSPHYFAVACRHPDGRIVTQCEEVDKSILGKLKWLNKPFLRGTLALIDAMALGTRALAFASNVQMEAEANKNEAERKEESPARIEAEEIAASAVNGPPMVAPVEMPKSGKINDIAIGGTIVFSFAFGIALFVMLPTLLTDFAQHHGLRVLAHGAHNNPTLIRNVSDGLIRIVIFFGYILLISLMPQIKAVFQYHGAEHKAINTLEAGLPLTKENALEASRIHPRCGTSFIFIVLIINLIVFAFLPRPPILIRFPMHLLVIPFVAGIAYEVIKFAGKYRRNPLLMAVLAPGMWSQFLTTREPNANQIEVALTSLRAVLVAEGHEVTESGQVCGLAPINPLEPEAVTA